MKRKRIALQITSISLIVLSFIACDKDFATIDSDIINEDNATNFDNLSQQYDVITYTKALGPVQSNNLGLSTLGVYDDMYGRTTSSFVTQLTLGQLEPDFGDEVSIDSVVLSIPYFSRATEVDEEGDITYEIDSVIERQPIKLSIFQSNYFLRNFDPNGDFNEAQAFFSNKSASSTENISDAVLENEQLTIIAGTQTSYLGDDIIKISNEGFTLNALDDEGTFQISQRQPPGIRLKLDPAFWQTKIIEREDTADLSSANNFAEYFRGLYFKAETVNNDGSFLILNTAATNSNITIYYTRLTPSTTDDANATEQATYVLRFGSNTVNFLDNNLDMPINEGDDINGDARIFLKGGEGSIGKIKLFNGENAFEDFKNTFVETENGKFVKSKRLVNEANLVFYVDQDLVTGDEPNRIYIYDAENNTPLLDYFLDGINGNVPSESVISHLGPLQREDGDSDGKGIKYKLKITEHINNLLLRDSTNVDLGLAVSLNVNLEETRTQRKVQTMDDSDLTLPVSSVLTPRGTILHGNNTEDESKRVYLEIYYTEPNN